MDERSAPLHTERPPDEQYWHIARTLRFYNSGRSKITHHDIENLFNWCNQRGIRSMDPSPNADVWFFHLLEIATPERLRGVCERALEHGILPRLQFVIADIQGSIYEPASPEDRRKPADDSAPIAGPAGDQGSADPHGSERVS